MLHNVLSSAESASAAPIKFTIRSIDALTSHPQVPVVPPQLPKSDPPPLRPPYPLVIHPSAPSHVYKGLTSPPHGSAPSRDVEANVNLNVNSNDNGKPPVALYWRQIILRKLADSIGASCYTGTRDIGCPHSIVSEKVPHLTLLRILRTTALLH